MVDTQLPDGTENDLTAGADPDPFITPLRNALMPDPGWTYGNQLPIKMLKDPATGQILDQDFGIPTGLRDFGNGILDLLQGTKTGEVTGDATRALAGLAIGKGLAAGPVGDDATATIFGGRGATPESLPGGMTGRMGRILQAQKIEDMGAGSPWGETGWYKDVDGKWKFEIPDQDAKLKLPDQSPPDMRSWDVADVGPRVSIDGPTKLGDILQHEKLFDAYPELENTTIKPLDPKLVDQGILGVARPDGSIELAPGHPDAVKSTLLHEIQHQIQVKEGFAVGGNPSEFLPTGHAEIVQGAIDTLASLHDQMKQITDPYTRAPLNPADVQYALTNLRAGYPLSSAERSVLSTTTQSGLLRPYSEALDDYTTLNKMSTDAMAKYRNLAGEVEARNVQFRMNLRNPSTVNPLSSSDRVPSDQIVRFYTKGADGSAMAAEPVDGDPFTPAHDMIRDNLKTSGWGTYDPTSSNQNAGPAISLRDTQNARVMDKLRSDNARELRLSGFYPLHQLDNGYTIAKSAAEIDPIHQRFFGTTDHALVSPNGTPVLYGNSPADLIRRGFPSEDNVKIGAAPRDLPSPRFHYGEAANIGTTAYSQANLENRLLRRVTPAYGRGGQDLTPKE